MAFSVKNKVSICFLIIAAAFAALAWHKGRQKSVYGTLRVANKLLVAAEPPPMTSPQYEPNSNSRKSQCRFDKVRYFVLFVGHSRTGHTLVSALIDAHPHIVIANEYGLLKRWAAFEKKQRTRNHVFDELYKHSVQDSLQGRGSTKKKEQRFLYSIPGEWAGKCQNYISVIGDKKGLASAHYFVNFTKGKLDDFRLLKNIVGVPFKVFHVIRNPYDNIATQVLRMAGVYYKFKESQKKFDNETFLIYGIKRHFALIGGYANMVDANWKNFEFMDIWFEDFCTDPMKGLQKICTWLEVDCNKSYLKHCVSIVSRTPSRTRQLIKWSPTAKELVEKEMKQYTFLQRYAGTLDS
eukprot:m.219927 g.219927  ORF g.219927 m.219927 type:complete len:351 (+) comp39930_c0_seq2:167-1219(+)